jgi:formylglycine-generating enzyme
MLRLASLIAVASTALFACKFEPHIAASGFPCNGNRDCPSGYQCAKATGAKAGICVIPCSEDWDCPSGYDCGSEPGVAGGVCCNNPDVSLCLPNTSGTGGAVVGTGGISNGSTGGAVGETGGATGSADAGPDMASPPANCADVCGSSATCGDCPAMLAADLGQFHIDSTEVTQAQFAAFVATSPSLAFLPASCAYKTAFGPSAACAASLSTDNPDQPVVCVDWCDAAAYCAWARKRLCGHVGGGALVFSDYTVASASQWQQACTSNGSHAYPYGDAYSAGSCNIADADGGFSSLGNVKSTSGCHAPSAPWNQVYDLSGNAAEWEDSCNATTGPNDFCRARGGSYFSSPDQSRCGADFSAPRNTTSPTIGFRCCSNP